MSNLLRNMAEAVYRCIAEEATHILVTRDIKRELDRVLYTMDYKPNEDASRGIVSEERFMGLKVVIIEGEGQYMIVKRLA